MYTRMYKEHFEAIEREKSMLDANCSFAVRYGVRVKDSCGNISVQHREEKKEKMRALSYAGALVPSANVEYVHLVEYFNGEEIIVSKMK